MDQKNNIDKKVVSDFGKEWKAFNHQHIDESILDSAFDSYFHIFPFSDVKNAEGFDMGCGSGRWSSYLSDLCCLRNRFNTCLLYISPLYRIRICDIDNLS